MALASAFKRGDMKAAERLLPHTNDIPNITTRFSTSTHYYGCRVSLVHLAAYHGWLDVVDNLVTRYGCNAHCADSKGHSSLHYAASEGHLEVVRYLISEHNCVPSCVNDINDTPLHVASSNGHLNIIQYLISVLHCNPSCENKIGDTPLHCACSNGHIDIVQYLIGGAHCNLSFVNNFGDTPLHKACSNGHLNMVQYLISDAHCNPSCVNNIGDTPLYIACSSGHLNIVKFLIGEAHCNPSCVNMNRLGNNTPLHIACSEGHLNIVQYLISEANCNPSCVDLLGNKPLHIACISGHLSIVQYLLSTGRVDPLAKNIDGKTPLYYASRCENSYEVLKLFQLFLHCRRSFPVDTYTKVILTGYSGAGKSTISQLIRLASRVGGIWYWLFSWRVPDVVEPFSVGIKPVLVESKVKEIGNMVIYDFADQQEYYSSHSAVLERIMKNSAVIFLCLVDLSQCMEKISESVHFWMSFIENACSTAQGSSHVIIVGSHADMIESHKELKKRNLLVESIAESMVEHLTYGGFVSMDCRELKAKDARHFFSLLSTSQQFIQASQPRISLYFHVLYAFLRTELKKPACTLQELIALVSKEHDFSVLVDSSVSLSELLTTLSDKGLIMFLPNQVNPQYSWVVVDIEALLRDVIGALFAPRYFEEYHTMVRYTGIVSVTTLQELLPQYNIEMLVSCLESMEFCHPVDPLALENTNFRKFNTEEVCLTEANLLFFPSLLINIHYLYDLHDHDFSVPRFGWCLGCSDPYHFFSNRFIHVLLLRLAFTFTYPINYTLSFSSVSPLCCMNVWRNGLSWKDDSGVTTSVEVIDHNRWVIVLVSEKSRQAAEICSSVIRMILHLRQELCKVLHVCECLISPSLLKKYPFDSLPDTDIFAMRDVARSMLLKHKFILGRNKLSTEEVLCYEPYYLMQPSSVCQLFNSSMADHPVPTPLLQEVLRYCQKLLQQPRDHKELRECVDKQSMFAGRNPLEVAELKQEDLQNDTASGTVLLSSHTTTTPGPVVSVSSTELPVALPSLLPTAAAGVSGDLSRTLGSNDLCDVLAEINQLNKWKELGLQLGLLLPTLDRIDREQRGRISECKMDMVSAWLQQQDNVSQKGVPSWNVLRAALKKIGENEMADKIK